MKYLATCEILSAVVLGEVSAFVGRVTSDPRLRPVHLAVAITFMKSWMKHSGCAFRISRRFVTTRSRIRSRATYHCVIRDLEEFVYVRYEPSYPPRKGSLFEILKPNVL